MTLNRPNPPPSTLSGTLEALRARYRASAPQLAAPFRELAQQLALDPDSLSVIEGVRAAAHRLRGTAGSYGFSQVSALAAALEARVLAWGAGTGSELEARSRIVGDFADALEVAFEAR